MKYLGKILHPVGHCMIVYAVFNTAQCRFRRHTLPENTQPMEFIEMMISEFNYIGSSDTSTLSGEYHKYDDVGESMTDITFVGPAEIGDGIGEIHQSVQNTAVEFSFIY